MSVNTEIVPMIDNPEKTALLLAALKASVPFEVELSDRLVKHLRAQNAAGVEQRRQTVSDVTYAGDEGGIVCMMAPAEKDEALVVSLTQVRVPRSGQLAVEIANYQKHRVKKLKRQGQL
jgi:hypothetical protein